MIITTLLGHIWKAFCQTCFFIIKWKFWFVSSQKAKFLKFRKTLKLILLLISLQSCILESSFIRVFTSKCFVMVVEMRTNYVAKSLLSTTQCHLMSLLWIDGVVLISYLEALELTGSFIGCEYFHLRKGVRLLEFTGLPGVEYLS